MEERDPYDLLYELVRSIPAGRVVTYGQAAALTEGVSLSAREAGAAMRIAPADVPWHRVVGAGGRLPIAKRSPDLYRLQRRHLEDEGVLFMPHATDRIDMARCQWLPNEPPVTGPAVTEEK